MATIYTAVLTAPEMVILRWLGCNWEPWSELALQSGTPQGSETTGFMGNYQGYSRYNYDISRVGNYQANE